MTPALEKLYENTRKAYVNFANAHHTDKSALHSYETAFDAQMREIKAQGKEAWDEYNRWLADRIGDVLAK